MKLGSSADLKERGSLVVDDSGDEVHPTDKLDEESTRARGRGLGGAGSRRSIAEEAGEDAGVPEVQRIGVIEKLKVRGETGGEGRGAKKGLMGGGEGRRVRGRPSGAELRRGVG